ncbi:hypothetical protein GYMLUDRAFT_55755 [Collybiopsis luxurians FD-317 M1]|nr:hypothetical protein GYMLUDRAFT_55755 [Collybiopsis luxurians FD-317 M1]
MTNVNNPAIISALQASSAQSNANCEALIVALQAENLTLSVGSNAGVQSSQPSQASGNTSHTICTLCICPHGSSIEPTSAWYAVFVGHATVELIMLFTRALVQALTTRVSGNTYHHFATKSEAEAAYSEADRLGLVHASQ